MLSIVEVPILVDASTNFQPTVALLQRAAEVCSPLAVALACSSLFPAACKAPQRFCGVAGVVEKTESRENF